MSGFIIGNEFHSRRHESRNAGNERLENEDVFVSDRKGWLDSFPSHKFDNLEDTSHDSPIMATGVKISSAEELHRDHMREEQRKWAWLRIELGAGAEAPESEFVSLDAEGLLAAAKKRKKAGSC